MADCQSLRDICKGLEGIRGGLNHLGIQKAPSRNALSHQNAKRDALVFRDIYRLLHKRLGQQTFSCRFREGIKASRIMLLDSSVITLCLNIFNWAHYSEEKGAIKLHTLFSLNDFLPIDVHVSDGKESDNIGAYHLMPPGRSIIVTDRGYDDTQLWRDWDSRGQEVYVDQKKLYIVCSCVYNAYMKSVFRNFVAIGAAFMCVWATAAQEVNVDDLLRAMREMTVSQGNRDVMGSIRKGRNKVPFSLSARGETIVFQYKHDNVWQRFDVRIKEKNADLVLVKDGKAQVMAPSAYGQTIAGTDVCYEDLSLRFLYWTGGKLIDDAGASRIKGRDCYIVEVKNPSPGAGQFAWVRMWVDKENGTTWQIDGYGADGKLKKRFSITSVQRLSDGTWFFKQMKLEVRNPQNPNRTIALDYLEMEDLPERTK